jgi:EmrB/QacA subfamily drug resistance transporter
VSGSSDFFTRLFEAIFGTTSSYPRVRRAETGCCEDAGVQAVATEVLPGRSRVMVGMLLAIGLAAMDATIVATAVPSIAKDLGGFSEYEWLFSAYLLTQAVVTPIYGKLADVFGRRPVLVAGVAVFLAGSALGAVAWSMWALIAFRAVQGVGAGGIQPLVMTLAGDLYSLEERPKVQGRIASVWAFAAIVGPATGGLFAEYVSWRWIFIVNLPVGAFALAVILANLREPELVRREHRLDIPGAFLLVVGAGLLVFGLLQGGVHWSWGSRASVLVFAGAGAALAVFVVQERRSAEPMLPLWLFTRRVLLFAALTSLAVGILMIGMTTFVPVYAQGVLGLGPVTAGFVLAAMLLGWSGTASFAGRLYLPFGFRNTALIGAACAIAGGVLLVLLLGRAHVWLALVACALMGAGMGLQSTPTVIGVQSVIDWGRRGVATGSLMFMRTLGQAVGAGVLGAVANSKLASWFRNAPPAVAARLPHTGVNAATSVLGSGKDRVHGAAAGFARRGVELATHNVFLGVAACTLIALAFVLALPHEFVEQRFED